MGQENICPSQGKNFPLFNMYHSFSTKKKKVEGAEHGKLYNIDIY